MLYVYNVFIISNKALAKFEFLVSLYWSEQPLVAYNINQLLHCIAHYALFTVGDTTILQGSVLIGFEFVLIQYHSASDIHSRNVSKIL